MTVTLGMDLAPGLEAVAAVLDQYDPVTRQKLLEVLTVRHAMQAGGRDGRIEFVVDAMHKHVRQILQLA